MDKNMMPSPYNQPVPFTSQMTGQGAQIPSSMTQPMIPGSSPGMPMPQDQSPSYFGNPQTESYKRGGAVKKRKSRMIEAHFAPDEIIEMMEAQGEPEYDKLTGRPVFKKLSRFMEHPHVERAIMHRFAQGGGIDSITNVLEQGRRLGLNRFSDGGNCSRDVNISGHRTMPGAERYSRGGDTTIAYITPHMARILDATGKGSWNPITKNREYFGLSDIWSGIKKYAPMAISGLNSVAPQLAQMVQPAVADMPGWQGALARMAVNAAPGLISDLNNEVNPQSQGAPFPLEKPSENLTPGQQAATQAGIGATHGLAANAENTLPGMIKRMPNQMMIDYFKQGGEQRQPGASGSEPGAAQPTTPSENLTDIFNTNTARGANRNTGRAPSPMPSAPQELSEPTPYQEYYSQPIGPEPMPSGYQMPHQEYYSQPIGPEPMPSGYQMPRRMPVNPYVGQGAQNRIGGSMTRQPFARGTRGYNTRRAFA